MKLKGIDNNQEFDWGKTSDVYAKYRDIYPQEFYDSLIKRGLCIKGQKVLDIGTGTGVIPRNLYKYGASFIGVDISQNQIDQARILADNMDISFFACRAEDLQFPKGTFDVITACQCFYYFDHSILLPKLYDMLKDHGKLVVLYMGWLSLESEIAYKSENLILKYNPNWNAGREERHHIVIPKEIEGLFDVVEQDLYDLSIPFSRDAWNGRMKSCRGVSASMEPDLVNKWEEEHKEMLSHYPEIFNISHFGSILILEKRAK